MSDVLPDVSVPVDLTKEQILSLPQAARFLPSFRLGKPVNPATIWRWIADGVKLPDGSRVRLEAIRLGSRWLTSAEALQRFAAAQTPPLTDEAGPPPHTPTQRERAAERAARELDAIGI